MLESLFLEQPDLQGMIFACSVGKEPFLLNLGMTNVITSSIVCGSDAIRVKREGANLSRCFFSSSLLGIYFQARQVGF